MDLDKRGQRPQDNYFNLTPKEIQLMMSTLEIDITEFCDLSCTACVRSSAQAPSTKRMMVKQIEEFVDDSIALAWKWGSIMVIGGEPTTHPQLFEILDTLERYHVYNPACLMKIMTHGTGPAARLLSRIPAWVEISNNRDAKKEPDATHHLPFNVAPIDVGEWDENALVKCSRIFLCGMGLTRDGYFGCHNSGGIHRVLKLGPGIARLKDVTFESLNRMIPLSCKYCGFYFEAEGRYKKYDIHTVTESWKKGYREYNKR